MPELPEVEVVRRGLADHVTGRRIHVLDLRGARVARRHLPGPADLADQVAGRWVRRVRRRGKYLWFELAEDLAGVPGGAPDGALILHLGMSGQLLVQDASAPEPAHLHAVFGFADDGPLLRFVDQRTFGGLAWSPLRPDGRPETIAHIAPDPFEPEFDAARVADRIVRSIRPVKAALLDQRFVSGIGNIYADEALWRAGIHGRRRGDALTRPKVRALLGHAREVMSAALEQGGTSFDALYVHVNGASGYFDRSLAAYGQVGRPCGRCGTLIVREHFMNRSSFFCPRCQSRPRTAS